MRLLIFLILLNFTTLFSQETDSSIISIPDTICYKYHFNVGDSLFYSAVSHDSIIINYGSPLIKSRFEEILITCDSIKNDLFYLTQQLISYKSFEGNEDTTNVERNSSPWLNRKAWFALDSLGYRKSVGFDDSLSASLTPGGAFQPPLIIPLGYACTEINKTWFVESLDELVENGLGLTIPLIQQASLFRALEPIDTLGFNCIRAEFIKTGQGSYSAVSSNETYKVTNKIAGAGVLDLDPITRIPVHLLQTSEIKMQIEFNGSEPIPGIQYILTNYTLNKISKKKKTLKK